MQKTNTHRPLRTLLHLNRTLSRIGKFEATIHTICIHISHVTRHTYALSAHFALRIFRDRCGAKCQERTYVHIRSWSQLKDHSIYVSRLLTCKCLLAARIGFFCTISMCDRDHSGQECGLARFKMWRLICFQLTIPSGFLFYGQFKAVISWINIVIAFLFRIFL